MRHNPPELGAREGSPTYVGARRQDYECAEVRRSFNGAASQAEPAYWQSPWELRAAAVAGEP